MKETTKSNKLKKKKILIIEDEPSLVDMYNEAFVNAGFKVISTDDLKTCMKLVKKEKPDLILLDILLPRENGITFLYRFKKDKDISSIPVIVFSNYDGDDVRKKAKELGAKEYLIKANYEPKDIIEKVNSYLK